MAFSDNVDFGNFLVVFLFAVAVAADTFCLYQYAMTIYDINVYVRRNSGVRSPVPTVVPIANNLGMQFQQDPWTGEFVYNASSASEALISTNNDIVPD
eukprot:CAMPEP_0202971548 /NCGR_PEP_ID=MMETSP1396-20130829/28363_1 /ASSEMBLY_ACC=CAM_ASM_000872 /TAXON_ID= /ORGANISM="Pseudokeronopsis sp., Strain Brazil" /LENGTH=97 /DNA_ID=CAMNT_0049701041 /DNA_START=312 /DNA_END=605 /DNA_ORIENTATION=+